MTRRIKAIVEYEGTEYSGWQLQKNANTVQAEIESALKKLLLKKIRVSAAGRTDAGVHAQGQVISVITDSSINNRGILKGTNSFLPPDIRLLNVCEVPDNFDPRRNAVLRWYRYFMINRSVRPVKGRRFISHVPYPLDFDLIRKVTSALEGDHDFSGFRSSECTGKRTRLNLELFQAEKDGDIIIFDLKCRSFLQNMVRILIGTVIEVSRGKIPLSDVIEILKSGKRDSRIATASAVGLTLMKVYYGKDRI
jgi:tRNA pseudouridine38-40 synthase